MPVELAEPAQCRAVGHAPVHRALAFCAALAYNQARGVKNVQLYETGVVFFGAEGRKKPKERQPSCWRSGWREWVRRCLESPNRLPFDFFDGKGVIENLIRELAHAEAALQGAFR